MDQIGLGVGLVLPLVRVGVSCELAASSAGEGPYIAVGWLLQILGWAFATLSVAGYTGLVRRG